MLYPSGESREYEIDESTTIESLMRTRIFHNEKLFKGQAEPQFYWLYSQEEDYNHFPIPLSREKKVLKLLYLEERKFER